MKTFIKLTCVAAVALAMTTFGTSQAQAGGWCVAGGVLGGLAVGTAVGATVVAANAVPPAYYAAPAPVYGAPAYYAPPAVAVAPVCYGGPRVVCGAPFVYGHPFVRVGFGWGPHYYHGGPRWHR